MHPSSSAWPMYVFHFWRITHFTQNKHLTCWVGNCVSRPLISHTAITDEYSLKWMDDEGDPCTINSDNELAEAIRYYLVIQLLFYRHASLSPILHTHSPIVGVLSIPLWKSIIFHVQSSSQSLCVSLLHTLYEIIHTLHTLATRIRNDKI